MHWANSLFCKLIWQAKGQKKTEFEVFVLISSQSFSAGGHCKRIWHGQYHQVFDDVQPALPLPTTAWLTFQGAPRGGFWLSSTRWIRCVFRRLSHYLLYPLTARVVGAPQMILQPVSSIQRASSFKSHLPRNLPLQWYSRSLDLRRKCWSSQNFACNTKQTRKSSLLKTDIQKSPLMYVCNDTFLPEAE